MVSLKWGLANSHNWVSAWLFKNFNPANVINLMRKMGVTSYIDPVPSMIYGTSDISLEEMVGAFNTFSNSGIYVSPNYVTRIEDRYGNVISTFHPNENEAISAETAYLMLTLAPERGGYDTERYQGDILFWYSQPAQEELSVYRRTGRENRNHPEPE